MTNEIDEPEGNGRCPECGEDEMDGAKCYYCGFHDYDCGVCDRCLATPKDETPDTKDSSHG